MVTFLPHELEYMKLLVKAIIDNPMRELSQTVALNMYKKVKKKKVTIAQSEATLEKFIGKSIFCSAANFCFNKGLCMI